MPLSASLVCGSRDSWCARDASCPDDARGHVLKKKKKMQASVAIIKIEEAYGFSRTRLVPYLCAVVVVTGRGGEPRCVVVVAVVASW